MAPETAVSSPWRYIFSTALFQRNLVLVAIDKAYCISEWLVQHTCSKLDVSIGSIFVPLSYLGVVISETAFTRIGGLRALTEAPFMALTASAPPNIQSAIVETLQLKNAAVVSCQLDRPKHLSLSLSKQRFECKIILLALCRYGEIDNSSLHSISVT